MVCEQARVVGMQSQVQLMEVLLQGTTPTAHPPRWLLLLQPPTTLASNVDKQGIGHVIAQVSAFARVVLRCLLFCMLYLLVRRDCCTGPGIYTRLPTCILLVVFSLVVFYANGCCIKIWQYYFKVSATFIS